MSSQHRPRWPGLSVTALLSALIIALVCSVLFASRAQAASFVVNSLGDAADANVGNGICATAGGVCTLRAALQEANANGATADTITFSVAGTIALTTGLPNLSSGNTTIAGANQTVTIDGSSLVGPACLYVTSAGNTIRGLIIVHCWGPAISVSGAGNTIGGTTPAERNVLGDALDGVELTGSGAHDNRIVGNYIGVDASGNVAAGNGDGVHIGYGPSNNHIGGSSAAERNIISGNRGAGISIEGMSTSGNTVSGNYIGTNSAGNVAVPNGQQGVWVWGGAHDNTIGGSSVGERNVISGNGDYGIGIGNFEAAGEGNVVKGNYIGTNAAGDAPLPNQESGVYVGGPNAIIGGSTTPGLCTAECNVISGNNGGGVEVGDDGNKVSGNYIGTDASGTVALPNQSNGVSFWASSNNIIGGSTPGERNVISGNNGGGVNLGGSANRVMGNYIGTNAAGDAALPNQMYGVSVGQNNTVGGSGPGEGNVISGNSRSGGFYGDGVELNGDGNTVSGNYIGTNARGDAALPNQGNGILIRWGAQNNTIGGPTAAERNVISGNGGLGVQLEEDSPPLEPKSGNRVMGNYIGTNAAGDAALPNQGGGVLLGGGSQNNTIGGSSAGERNIISGNAGSGVQITGFAGSTFGNEVSGNYIGTNAAGTAALPNQGSGVGLEWDTQDNIIGGSTEGERNVISGNSGYGVRLGDGGSNGNTVKGNYIGTNALGNGALPNQQGGVLAGSNAPNNTIGGPTAAERNVISGNTDAGIELEGNNNTVEGNYVGVNAAGTAPLPNGRGLNLVLGASNNTVRNNVVSGNSGVGIRIAGELYVLSGSPTEPAPIPIDGCIDVTGYTEQCADDGYVGPFVLPAGYYRVQIDITGCLRGDLYEFEVSTNEAEARPVAASGTCNVHIDMYRYYWYGPATGNVVQGNFVGTGPGGGNALPNGGAGIDILGWATNNAIGGTGAGQGNAIAFNGGNGVQVRYAAADRNTVRGNSIHDNGDIGIDLDVDGDGVLDGPSPNDPGDPDQGANEGLNFPVITSALPTGVSGTACPGCTVDIYSDDDGEGRVYEGSTTAGPGGAFTWVGTASGPKVTTTATDGNGNTSEFSPPVPLSTLPDLVITKTASPPDGSSVSTGATITYTLTASNAAAATATATNVVIRDYIGTGLTFVSATPGSGVTCGAYDPVTRQINCTAASISPGESRTLTIAVTVTATSGTVLNGARVDPTNAIAESNEDADDPDRDCAAVGEGTDAADPTEPDNFDCTGHPMNGQPDLTVTKTASPADGSSVSTGSTITYTLTVCNSGGATATNVVIRDTVGSGLTFVSATPGSGVTCGAYDPVTRQINCTAASIGPSECRTVIIPVTVNATSGTVLNGARVDPANVIAELNEDADDPDRDCSAVGEGTDVAPATEPDNFDCTGHSVGGTVLRIDPPEKTCYLGGSCSVDIVVENVTNLGSFEFILDFNPSVIRFDYFEEGPFLKSTGRSTSCNGFPVGNGSEQFGCASGSATGQAGPSGSGVLAKAFFTPLAEGETPLDLHNTALYDATPEVNPIDHTVQDGRLIVRACLCRADVDCDGDVDIRDVALVFAAWPSPPKPYDQRYDMDLDGDIDIRDVALVFGQWPSPPKTCTL